MKTPQQSPILLSEASPFSSSRHFHVERLKGGMNRLLLRAFPTKAEPTRVEVLFQYSQYVDMPMEFEGLAITDVTATDSGDARYLNILAKFPDCRLFRLESQGATAGHVVAAACGFGEDAAPLGAESMFPLMG